MEKIESATFRYSSKVVPVAYLRQLGFSPVDEGRFPYPVRFYSLHDGFTARNPVDLEWVATVGVFAPEQADDAYGPKRQLHMPLVTLGDANLYGLSLRFDNRPGIRTLRELEAAANSDGLLGEVFVMPIGNNEVAFASTELIDQLDASDFPESARREILVAYGLRDNNIKVLNMPYRN